MSLRFSILFCYLLSNCLTSVGQASNRDSARIRQTIEKINSDGHLKNLVLTAEDFLENIPDGGATLGGFFAKDKLVKISENIGLSYGIRQRDFYYDSAMLIFCFVAEKHFLTTDTGLIYDKTKLVMEAHYYFKNGHLIKRQKYGTGFWDKEDEATILPDSKEYSKLLIGKMGKGK